MQVPFSKYVGCGNDFILFDNRSESLSGISVDVIRQLCHRQEGIGADGVIFLEESGRADFKMRIFNADGSEAEMCGNGIRCLMKFIQELGIGGSLCTIETMQRILKLQMDHENVCVDMGDPAQVKWDVSISVGSTVFTLQLLNTGVPHAVLFVDQIDAFDLAYWGPKIRYHPFFHPQGTNVTVAAHLVNGEMSIRTYERGVEGETLACGTGATAAALAAAYVGHHFSPIRVRTRSNEILTIGFRCEHGIFSAVTMTGPAKRTYQGEVAISHRGFVNNSTRTCYVCKN